MLDYIPHLKMYVASNPPPPVFALRAWVEFTPTLPRVLCDILSVDQNVVQVQPLNNPLTFWQSRAQIHSVHRASLTTGEVVYFYGEPKPC